MMNGWLWNFACMSGTMMPTMCRILVVTQWSDYIYKNVLLYYLRCFTDMALHNRYAVTLSVAVAKRSPADCSSIEGHTSLSTTLAFNVSKMSVSSENICILLFTHFSNSFYTIFWHPTQTWFKSWTYQSTTSHCLLSVSHFPLQVITLINMAF